MYHVIIPEVFCPFHVLATPRDITTCTDQISTFPYIAACVLVYEGGFLRCGTAQSPTDDPREIFYDI